MTREEHRKIISFIESAVRPDHGELPPAMDVEADAIIRALFVRNPEAAYRVTLLAMMQADELQLLRTALDQQVNGRRRNWLTRWLQKTAVRRDYGDHIFPRFS